MIAGNAGQLISLRRIRAIGKRNIRILVESNIHGGSQLITEMRVMFRSIRPGELPCILLRGNEHAQHGFHMPLHQARTDGIIYGIQHTAEYSPAKQSQQKKGDNHPSVWSRRFQLLQRAAIQGDPPTRATARQFWTFCSSFRVSA